MVVAVAVAVAVGNSTSEMNPTRNSTAEQTYEDISTSTSILYYVLVRVGVFPNLFSLLFFEEK